MNSTVNTHHSIGNITFTSTRQRNRSPAAGIEPSSFTCIMLYIVFVISFISSHVPVAAFFCGPRPSTNHAILLPRPTLFDLSATTFDSPPSSEMSDFQRRMRKLINSSSDKKKKSMQQSNNKNAPKNLMRVDTLEEYKNVISGNRDKLIVVRFYAPWCKACKAIAPAFYRLAITYPNTLFLDVPVTPDNANLHQGLGVTTLPFGHIYHPIGGLVEEIKISKKHFARFAQVLKTYIDGKCDVSDYEGEVEHHVQQGQRQQQQQQILKGFREDVDESQDDSNDEIFS